MQSQKMRWWPASMATGLGIMAIAILNGCGGGNDNGGPINPPTTPSVPNTPSPPNPPSPPNTPSPSNTPSPPNTPAPAEVRTVTVFSTSGAFSRSTGQFRQSNGTFERLRGNVLPSGAPDTPGSTPSNPNSDVVIYIGTYTLQSGETGEFLFTSLPSNTGDGVGAPPQLFRFQGTPETIASGRAAVTLQISGSTGSGTIQLSNNDRGTITITSRTGNAAQVQAALQKMSQIKTFTTQR